VLLTKLWDQDYKGSSARLSLVPIVELQLEYSSTALIKVSDHAVIRNLRVNHAQTRSVRRTKDDSHGTVTCSDQVQRTSPPTICASRFALAAAIRAWHAEDIHGKVKDLTRESI
jgi:hypothetical protein